MAVVRETLLIIEPGDVLKILIRCTECKMDVVYSPEFSTPDFRSCRLCSAQWDNNKDGDKEQREKTISLFDALHYFWSDGYKKRRRDKESLWDITLILPGDFD